LHYVRVGDPAGAEYALDADLILLAMGFTGPVKRGLLDQLGAALDSRGNLATEDFQTSVKGVFAAGDARRGQSLVVWAIAEGRKTAAAMDRYLTTLR
jgi:glutamate synthase (NADPH/NADH) small chain